MNQPLLYPPIAAKLVIGVNDLFTLYPHIAAELIDVDPKTILATSVKKLSWKCTFCQIIWQTAPKSRVSNIEPKIGCATCNGKNGIIDRSKKRTLNEVYPRLAEELVDKSVGDEVTFSSHVDVEWKCTKFDHTYMMSVNKHVNGRGCPFCAFRETLVGFNNIAAVAPYLVSEIKNLPDQNIIANSRENITWAHTSFDGIIHEWEATPKNRIYKGTKCHICSGSSCEPGVNDFKTVFLDNSNYSWGENNFNPTEISWGSNKRIELFCNIHPNYIISATAKRISNKIARCLECFPPPCYTYRSKAELEIIARLEEEFPHEKIENNVCRFKRYGVYEIDALVNEKIAIEFNGSYWHKEGKFKPIGYHENKKNLIENDLGMVLLNVEEDFWLKDKEKVLNEIVEFVESNL